MYQVFEIGSNYVVRTVSDVFRAQAIAYTMTESAQYDNGAEYDYRPIAA